MVAKIEIRTQEIQVITVYGPDYDAMRRKSAWCIAGFAFYLFGGMLGIIHILIKNGAIDFDTFARISVLLGCSVIIALSSMFFIYKHHSLYQNFMLQNGWNPKYEHELKLDYQTFLHD